VLVRRGQQRLVSVVPVCVRVPTHIVRPGNETQPSTSAVEIPAPQSRGEKTRQCRAAPNIEKDVMSTHDLFIAQNYVRGLRVAFVHLESDPEMRVVVKIAPVEMIQSMKPA